MDSKSLQANMHPPKAEPAEVRSGQIIADEKESALTVLEADQLVATKQRTRFGRRRLSRREELLLWGLRIYVIVMLLIVLFSVLHALRGAQ